MSRKVVLLFAVVLVLCVLSPALAQPAATVMDENGVQVTLSALDTREIELAVGSGTLVIPVDSICSLTRDEDEQWLILKTVSGQELKGSSDSMLVGTWDLGKYSISLSQVKSVEFGHACAPSSGRTEETQCSAGTATARVVVVQPAPIVVETRTVIVEARPVVLGAPRPYGCFGPGGFFDFYGILSLSFSNHYGVVPPHGQHHEIELGYGGPGGGFNGHGGGFNGPGGGFDGHGGGFNGAGGALTAQGSTFQKEEAIKRLKD